MVNEKSRFGDGQQEQQPQNTIPQSGNSPEVVNKVDTVHVECTTKHNFTAPVHAITPTKKNKSAVAHDEKEDVRSPAAAPKTRTECDGSVSSDSRKRKSTVMASSSESSNADSRKKLRRSVRTLKQKTTITNVSESSNADSRKMSHASASSNADSRKKLRRSVRTLKQKTTITNVSESSNADSRKMSHASASSNADSRKKLRRSVRTLKQKTTITNVSESSNADSQKMTHASASSNADSQKKLNRSVRTLKQKTAMTNVSVSSKTNSRVKLLPGALKQKVTAAIEVKNAAAAKSPPKSSKKKSTTTKTLTPAAAKLPPKCTTENKDLSSGVSVRRYQRKKSLHQPTSLEENGIPFWDTLGKLKRCDHGQKIEFSWIPTSMTGGTVTNISAGSDFSPLQNCIHRCIELGRVYYEGFILEREQYRLGDCVYLHHAENEGKPEAYFRIAAAFQATKSFRGEEIGNKKEEQMIQKRGYPYILLAPLSFTAQGKIRRKQENLLDLYPCNIVDNRRILRKESSTENLKRKTWFKCSATEPCIFCLKKKWPDHIQTEQVQCIQSKRELSCKPAVRHYESFDYSSDDSDQFDEKSRRILGQRSAFTSNEFKNNFLKKNRSNFNLDKKKSMPQVLMFGVWKASDPIKVEEKREMYENRLDWIKQAPDQFKQDPEFVRRLQKFNENDQRQLQALSPLSDYFDIRRKPDPTLAKSFRKRYKKYMPKILRRQQADVTAEVLDPKGSKYVVFLAPCGHGKTKIFEMAALIDGGITLVVEPLKVLIQNQVERLASIDGIEAENLCNREDSERKECPRAVERLQQIVASASTEPNQTRILFATPELLSQEFALKQLKAMAKLGVLRRVVIDEFDVIGESHKNSRGAYTTIVPSLSKELPSFVRFLFLSGTTNKDTLLAAVPSLGDQEKPVLFMTERPLSDTLAFSVERKINNEQVADRIESMLGYYIQRKKVPRCLCYCLTRSNCEQMESLLNRSGNIKAASVHGNVNGNERERIIKDFNSGKIQVLCTNKAMGRGFHSEKPIKFVFHTCLPTSLNDLVQETARGGRDGSVCHAVLFFRPHDAQTVKRVISGPDQRELEGKEKERFDENRRQMMRYCVTKECRYEVLAEHVRPKELSGGLRCTKQSRCDNCSINLGSTSSGTQQVDQDISAFVKEFIEKLEIGGAVTEVDADKLFWITFEERYKRQGEKESLRLNPFMREANRSGNNIRNDLLRVLVELEVLSFTGHNKYRRFEASATSSDFAAKLEDGILKIFLRSSQFPDLPDSRREKKVQDELSESDLTVFWRREDRLEMPIDSLGTAVAGNSLGGSWATGSQMACNIPFLIQFELKRLKEKIANGGENLVNKWNLANVKTFFAEESSRNPSTVCSKLKELQSDVGSRAEFNAYDQILNDASSSGLPIDANAGTESFGGGSALFFRASIELHTEVRLILLQPERAFDRRAYRKFGSHRFLHVDVPQQLSMNDLFAVIRDQICVESGLCGRKYGYLWCKAAKRPQQYVFFAEKGSGIATEDELTVDQVRNWLLPPACNMKMSLEKELKRIKLNFSQTTPAGILPEGTVELIPDIMWHEDVVQTDGCGLVSTEALDFIWKAYQCYLLKQKQPTQMDSDLEEVDRSCPYTSFQGRIGGFKGEWVLDPTLKGFKICCRHSQKKYELPMKCLREESRTTEIQKCYKLHDQLYDTVDVCGWDDKPVVACLSIPVIQILEHRGVKEEYFVKLAEKATQTLEAVFTSNKNIFRYMEVKHAAAVRAKGESVEENDNWGLLHRMSGVNLNPNEPVFARKKSDFMQKELETMRAKARYPLSNCFYLRMLPDHMQLLEEGEAFVAIRDERLCRCLYMSEYVLAMRHPSYFAGDLRKLKLVTRNELNERAANKDKDSTQPGAWGQKGTFFDSLQLGIVLSTKGNRSEADKMSGGDYDGDEAWVCWDRDLVDKVSDADPVNTSTKEFTVRDPPEEFTKKNLQDYHLTERIRFARHYLNHQNKLGQLSSLLSRVRDKEGVDSKIARKVATQAFLQVDHPYYLCDLVVDEDTRYLENIQWPNWNPSTKQEQNYTSTRVLGKLWDLLGQKIANMNNLKEPTSFEPNQQILEYINNSMVNESLKSKYRVEMKIAAENYDKELSKVMKVLDKDVAQRRKRIWIWRRQYCEEQRQVLIEDKAVNHKAFAAAVLYQQATLLTEKRSNAIPKLFAWHVADDLLLQIVGNAGTSHRRGPRQILFEFEPCLYTKTSRR